MATNDAAGHKPPATDGRRIDGPIPEYNQYSEYTGTTYYRCTRRGAESLRRIDLEGCCDGA